MSKKLMIITIPLFVWMCMPASTYANTFIPGYSTVEYTWWLGCSPTAAGMMFAWWDTQGGKTDLYDGDASVWDFSATDYTVQANYVGTHRMVASWEHYQAGQALSTPSDPIQYGSWQNHTPNCLADFMKTHDGGTSRLDMAQGFEDFAMWDDPTTALFESYYATATTDFIPDPGGWWVPYVGIGTFDYSDLTAWIDAGKPLHLGISGHSVLVVGYDEDEGVDVHGGSYYCWSTWAGDHPNVRKAYWDGTGIGGRSVYGCTYLDIDGKVPIPAAVLLGLLGLGTAGMRLRRKKVA